MKKETIITLIIGALLIAGFFLYSSLNGLPLTHPGNIKAADPFYHTTMTESILSTNQWKYYPSFAARDEKMISIIPPLLNLNAAGLSFLSGLPPWASTYYLVVLAEVLLLLFIYLLTKEVFENTHIALTAAALMLLPPPVAVWMYGLYIGFWIQVVSFSFVICYAWLYVRFLKKGGTACLYGMSASMAISALTHPQEMVLYAIPSIYIAYTLLQQKTTVVKKVMNGLAYGLPLLIVLIIELPWFLYAWGQTSSYRFGWFGIRNLFPTDYLGGLPTPHYTNLPWHYLALFLIGIILILFFTKKRNTHWLAITAYILAYMYILPHFLASPHYIGRARWFIIPLAMPTIAYTLYVVLQSLLKQERFTIAGMRVLAIIAILLALPGYGQLVQGLSGEHITQEKWEAYTWIRTNTLPEESFLFIEGCGQANCIMTRRPTVFIRENELPNTLNRIATNKSLPSTLTVDWSTDTLYDYPTREASRWKFTTFNKTQFEKNNIITPQESDYIFFEHINQDLKSLNFFIAQLYNNTHAPVYSTERFLILKKVKP